MPCSFPLRGFRAKSGKLTFNLSQSYSDLPLEVPCGQCKWCRLNRSRQRALQCLHEASQHSQNAFLTLTYDDSHLPPFGSLVKSHFQLFMKRYRKWLNSHRISYYMCGEYGDQSHRPHYHALLFGHDFSDKKFLKSTHSGDKLYTSEKLSQLWTHGFCTIGDLTFESAAYVARYVTKKMTGKKAALKYGEIVNIQTGEITPRRIPEYGHPSHGLGKKWFAKYMDDTYPSDSVALRGKLMKPPKYYDKLYAELHPEEFEKIKCARIALAKKSAEENTWERRLASEKIKSQQASLLKRTL